MLDTCPPCPPVPRGQEPRPLLERSSRLLRRLVPGREKSGTTASRLTTMLTTTHDDTGGHKRTLRSVKSSKTQMWWTCADTSGRNEATSTTTGLRRDFCPTCR